MLVDLVRITTPDGVLLDGVLQRSPTPPAWPMDAVLLIHGTGSNFYQSTLLETLAEMFLSRGVSPLRVNTRGHDGISTAVKGKGGIRQGAAYEAIDDCRHDVLGWASFARAQVGPRVALLGHSMGAVKCLYAAAHEAMLTPAMVLAVSPPRLAYERFCSSPRREEFLETFDRAETLVAAGQAAALIEATIPLPMVISAGGYVDKYGPGAANDFLPLLPNIACRVLFTFGEQEVANNVAFQGLPADVAAAGRAVTVVPAADHFYSGRRSELAAVLAAAIDSL